MEVADVIDYCAEVRKRQNFVEKKPLQEIRLLAFFVIQEFLRATILLLCQILDKRLKKVRRRKVILKLLNFEYSTNSIPCILCCLEEVSCLNCIFKHNVNEDYKIILDIFSEMFFGVIRTSDEMLENIRSKVWNVLHDQRINFDLLHHLDDNVVVSFFQRCNYWHLVFSNKVIELFKKLCGLFFLVIFIAELMNGFQEIVNQLANLLLQYHKLCKVG